MNKAIVKAAILAGADLLEQNPDQYNFFVNVIDKRGFNCMVGFIGKAAGYPSGTSVRQVGKIFGIYSLYQHERVNVNIPNLVDYSGLSEDDRMQPAGAVAIMREFAEKFYS